jgi:predicted RND superfamily exporter protein
MLSFLSRCNHGLSTLLLRHRAIWFLIGLALTAAAIPLAQRLSYNRSMEGFFPRSDPRLQLYLQNKQWFSSEATLIVAYTEPGLWTAEGMQAQQQLVELLKQQPGVMSASSLATSPLPKPSLLNPLEPIGEALQKPGRNIEQFKKDVQAEKLYHGVFVAADMQTTAVWLQVRFDGAKALAEGLERIRNTAHQKVPDAAVAGTFMMIHDVYEHTERDGRVLEIVSVLVMGLVIAVSFRSLRWIILPLLIVYSALWWSQGLWALVRGELTMVSSAISSLVAVTGVATVVHFGLRYRELLSTMKPVEALTQTFTEIGPPVFWILATNAAGFGALLVCELKPVLDFAWIMVIASMLLGLAAMLYLPLGVTQFQRSIGSAMTGHDTVSHGLVAMLRFVRTRPYLTMCVLIVPGVLIGLGMLRLQPQTDFTNNFRQDTEIYRSYDFIETRMAGAGQLDLVWDGPDLAALPDQERDAYLRKLQQLEEELAELTGVTKVLGLADFLDFAARRAPIRLPFSLALAALDSQGITPLFWNRAEGKMRLTLQVKERLPSEAKQALIETARRKAENHLGAEASPRATGIYVMLAHLIDSLLGDQNKTFALSLLLQFAMGWMAFRRISLAVAAMVPTVLPVVATVGVMGWLGLPVNIATAMLASVAMGMTIDSSILYIYRFQQERAAGADFDTALVRTHGTAGIAVVLSNLALVLGFAVLTISRFIPLVHFGIFTSLALVGGMVGNLVLLPLLLGMMRRRLLSRGSATRG